MRAVSTAALIRQLPRTIRRKLPRTIRVVPVSSSLSWALNRRYRKKNAPANTLSFRYGPAYGEILLCPTLIRREAKARGNSIRYQMTWMVIHGMLHLAGMHHERSAITAKKVERLERTILDQLFP
jgi:probable rRNA maturation factor